MRGRYPRNARAKKRCDPAHSRPTLYHGVPRIFLTTPLSYEAVAFHLGQCEKLLRYVKLATSAIESKHINLRTRIKRLVRRTICLSKTTTMHDLVLGLFSNRYEFGLLI